MIKHVPKNKFLLLSGDIFLISAAYFLAPAVRYGTLAVDIAPPWGNGLAIAGIYVFIFYLADLYDTSQKFTNPNYIFRFLTSVLVAALTALAILFLFSALSLGRGAFFIKVFLIVAFTYSWRFIFACWFKSIMTQERKLLIVGAGRAGGALYRAIANNHNYKVLGFIDDDPSKWGKVNSPPVLGGCACWHEWIDADKVDAVVLAIARLKGPELLKCALHSRMKGIDVYDLPSFYEEATGKIPVRQIDDFWFCSTHLPGMRRNIYTRNIKRFLDIILALAGLIMALPVIVAVAIAIKLDSPGPALYRQKRTGLNGQEFDIVKFRSMTVDAEKNGAVWAKEADPRVTRVGKIIRKLRIDEIPQMWNVLRGEMSFIGPRPERPEFVALLSEKIPYYSLRHSLRPGITGWAQVMYRYGASEEDALEKLQYDFYYLKNRSPLLDFHILLRTMKVILWLKGSR